MNDYFVSQVRTWVPVAVGAVLAWLASHGTDPHLSTTALETLVAGLTGLFTALYYALARLLERHVSSKFGWLLGYAKAPTYTVKPVPES